MLYYLRKAWGTLAPMPVKAFMHPLLRTQGSFACHVNFFYGKRLLQACGGRIATGPFQGAAYPDFRTRVFHFGPSLLGTYEKELWPVLERLVRGPSTTIVNIGAAEGYYAIGLALRRPDHRIVAFEQSAAARRLLRENCAANSLPNNAVDLRETCTPARLRDCVAETTGTILCDAEGAEAKLLDPASLPELAHWNILVETHDSIGHPTQQLMIDRFEGSHATRLIRSADRGLGDWPAGINGFADAERLALMNEFRVGPQSWIHFEARCSTAR